MLIQYKKPSFLGETSGLSKHKLYRVLGIITPLDGACFHFDRGTCEAVVMEDEAHADMGSAADLQFVPISHVEIVDQTIPKDWQNAVVSIPSSGGAVATMLSSPEFLNENFFITTYFSPAITRKVVQKIHTRYESYGKNIKISENQERCRDEYQKAEHRLDRLIRKSLTDISSVFDLWECSYYSKNLGKAIAARTNFLAETSNQKIRNLFAGKIIHYLMTLYFALNENFVIPESLIRICDSAAHFMSRGDKHIISSTVKSLIEFSNTENRTPATSPQQITAHRH
ncbi:MAG: hypothetical protein ACK5MU_04935 [Candidatus Saccharimonadales bacterium]